MKLIYKIALTLSVALSILMAVWAVLFYFATVDEINDETDDSLIEYSNGLILRKLSGETLPSADNGTNNTYYIKEVTAQYAGSRSWLVFEDDEIYISTKGEHEPARILTRIFEDNSGRYHELTVAVPTFEKKELLESILFWLAGLYLAMLLSIIVLSIAVFDYNMKPLKAVLKWLDDFSPGLSVKKLPDDNGIREFDKLCDSLNAMASRLENQFAEQKKFIGNASHELQTPLASCSNRIELLLDSEKLTDSQAEEIVKVHRSLQQIIRLNKTLLLLTKIEYGQFPDSEDIDFYSIIKDKAEMMGEIYSGRQIRILCQEDSPFRKKMNPELAGMLVSNLMKNAVIHSPKSSVVKVVVSGRSFSVSNPGAKPLDSNRVFTRFYQGDHRNEGSTGLGLAIVSSICQSYGMSVTYDFTDGCHIFTVISVSLQNPSILLQCEKQ